MYCHIAVQTDDFDLNQQLNNLRQASNNTGAIVNFVGLVRDCAQSNLTALELEHYPGMTELSLKKMVDIAGKHFALTGVCVIHRVGEIKLNQQIVLVACASQHRQDAFNACEFLMDYLKTHAPFWKKETINGQAHWVDARHSDSQALQRWQHLLTAKSNRTKP